MVRRWESAIKSASLKVFVNYFTGVIDSLALAPLLERSFLDVSRNVRGLCDLLTTSRRKSTFISNFPSLRLGQ